MRYVKYIGLAHVRQITSRDWRSVGITADTVQWSAQNGFAVPLDQFTDDQLVKAIHADPEFVVTGEDENFTPKPQAMDMTPSALVQTTEEPVDVFALGDGNDVPSTDDSDASPAPGGAAPTTTTTGGTSRGEVPGDTVH